MAKLPWWVDIESPNSRAISMYSTLVMVTWMLVVAQWTSALWLATVLKKATVPQYLPSGRAKFGLLILLVVLYGFQYWLLVPPGGAYCLDNERNFDAKIITSCYPASHMLKSLAFFLVPFVLFFFIWFSWDDAKITDQVERDTTIGPDSEEQARNNGARYNSGKDLESATPAVRKIPKKIIPYLLNIKVFLTMMVITSHVIQTLLDKTDGPSTVPLKFTIDAKSAGEFVNLAVLAFVAGNGEYFLLPTFFFTSGYFTRRSLVKKGVSGFLFDRAKRLALPFAGFGFFLNPYVLNPLFSMLFVGKTYIAPVNVYTAPSFNFYLWNTDVMWFLNWLMAFSTFYAFTSKCFEKEWKLPISLSMFLFKVSLALSVTIFLCSLVCDGALVFLGMPAFTLRIALYSVFFFGGIVAGKNEWLEDLEERLEDKKQGRKLRLIVHSFALVCAFVVMIAMSAVFLGYPKTTDVYSEIGMLLVIGIVSAFQPVWIAMSIILIFMDYFNSLWPKFLLAASYSAYILQSSFMMLGLYAVTAAAGLDAKSVYYPGLMPGNELNPNLAIPYVLLGSSIAISGSYLFGFALRSLPNFDQVF